MALALEPRVDEARDAADRIEREQMTKLYAYLTLSPTAREMRREQVRRRLEFEDLARKYRL